MNYKFSDFCLCPKCLGSLKEKKEEIYCKNCNSYYPVRNGIPILIQEPKDNKKEYIESYVKLAKDDLENPVVSPKIRRGVHLSLIKFIGDIKGKKVLDIGSGQGIYLQEIDAGFKVALDIAFPYLEKIPKNNITPVCADAETLPIVSGFFDIIIISDILEHLINPELLVNRVWEISRPDTRIIVHIPWEENLTPYLDMKYKYTHLRAFSSFEIFSLFCKFKLVRRKFTYPNLNVPIFFQIEPWLPLWLFNWLHKRFFFKNGEQEKDTKLRKKWMEELPKREKWLLMLCKPLFRLLEFRKMEF